jgi:hypothetical protein
MALNNDQEEAPAAAVHAQVIDTSCVIGALSSSTLIISRVVLRSAGAKLAVLMHAIM